MDNGFRTTRGYHINEKEQTVLTDGLEDYLEMICRLCADSGYTRVGRLSENLQVKPSSASKMVAKLINLGLIRNDENGSILPTVEGETLGRYLIMRHEIIENFLMFLGSESALRETELIEHFFTESTVRSIRILMDFFDEYSEYYEKYLEYKNKV